MSLYVYALLAKAPSEGLGTGMSGEALRVVTCGRLLAVVGDTSARPPVTSTALREHDRTIRRITAVTDAVLPMRFGSMVDEELELARHLEPAEAALEAALVLVAGREQMTVRVYERQARAEEGTRIAAPPAAAANLGPGARYLLERRQTLENDPHRAALDAVLAAPAAFIRGQRIESHGSPPLIASVHHLIERGQGEAYAAVLHAGTADLIDAAVTVSGPWPPYAFASGELA
jgi:Gas vesicle synthesis protein GvpL/GvpF